jgi:hypothetical protein
LGDLEMVKVDLSKPGHRVGSSVYLTERWKQLSRKLRKERKHCEICGAYGKRTVVDHIRELRDGGDPYDLANLRVVCWPCHGRVTRQARERRAALKGRGGGAPSAATSSLATSRPEKESLPRKSIRDCYAESIIHRLKLSKEQDHGA